MTPTPDREVGLLPRRILHVLSQRPGRTGSGVTLEAVTRQAALAGWSQAAVVGTPADDPAPPVGVLGPEAVFPVTFGDSGAFAADLAFALPGMSDVMPYPSSVWSALTPDQVQDYRQAWARHLSRVIDRFQPDIIHAHHVWLASSLLPDLAGGTPVALTCHATGLRQMELCPHLAPEVIAGCRRAHHFFALRRDHQRRLATLLQIDPARVTVTGVGFREDVFHPNGRLQPQPGSLLFVGKFSRAKGLPWLLDAVEHLHRDDPATVLHVAGGGSGPEADLLRRRLEAMGPVVVNHGQLAQEPLADLMRRCRVAVLPSFYEGVPLVLAEAAACGCRVVATDLPGVREQLAQPLGSLLFPVSLPALVGIDEPDPAGLAGFTRELENALRAALQTPEETAGGPTPGLESLTWAAVFARIEAVWRDLIDKKQSR